MLSHTNALQSGVGLQNKFTNENFNTQRIQKVPLW